MQFNSKQQILNRAKLFTSYDALKGFSERIKAKERIIVKKPELMEDQLYELDWKLKSLSLNQMIEVIYFDKDAFVKRTGIITKIDLSNEKILKVVEQEIKISNIISIEELWFHNKKA